MRLSISHDTTYRYEDQVRNSIQYLRMTPHDSERQQVLSWQLTLPRPVRAQVDPYGNILHVLKQRYDLSPLAGFGPGKELMRLPALAAARAGAEVTLMERLGCFGGNITTVGVEGFAWYRHAQTVEAHGIGWEFEERAKAMGAAVPESQSLSYELDSEGFKLVAEPKAKRAEFFGLATPLKIKGKFDDFRISMKGGALTLGRTAVRFAISPVTTPLKRLFQKDLPGDGADICLLPIGPHTEPLQPLPGC